MDELDDFKKLLDDIKDGVPEREDADETLESASGGPLMKNGDLFKKPVFDERGFSSGKSDRVLNANDNTLWNENKEIISFGLLSSVLLSIVGVISSIDYLTLVGAIGSLLFVILIFLLMFNYSTSFRKTSSVDVSAQKKIEELSRKIDFLNTEKIDFSQDKFSMPDSKIQEMEGKIEELRVIVRSLVKVVESGR